MDGGAPRNNQKKAASAPAIPGVVNPFAPKKEAQRFNMSSWMNVLDDILAPAAAPAVQQPTQMEVEGEARGRTSKIVALQRMKANTDIKKKKIAKQYQQLEKERSKLLEAVEAKKLNIPLENFQAMKMVDRRIEHQTSLLEKQTAEIAELQEKLAAAQANAELTEAGIMNYHALREYIVLKGLEGSKLITPTDVYKHGVDIMNQSGGRY